MSWDKHGINQEMFQGIYIYHFITKHYKSGRWFGTFFSIYWEQSSQLTFIFFRGVETTNQKSYYKIWRLPFQYFTGCWFETFGLCSMIYVIRNPLTFIFFKTVKTTNQFISQYLHILRTPFNPWLPGQQRGATDLRCPGAWRVMLSGSYHPLVVVG